MLCDDNLRGTSMSWSWQACCEALQAGRMIPTLALSPQELPEHDKLVQWYGVTQQGWNLLSPQEAELTGQAPTPCPV